MEGHLEGLEESSVQPWGNVTMTCAAKGLMEADHLSLPIGMDSVLRMTQPVYFSFVAAIGILMNLLVVILVILSKDLRNKSFAIAVQIAFANIFTIVGGKVPSIVQYSFGQPIFGLNACTYSGYFLIAIMDTRVLLMFAFSLDRFASVFAPYLYPRHNLAVIIFTSLLAWIFPMAFKMVGIPQLLDCYSYAQAFHSCMWSMTCGYYCRILHVVYHGAVIFPAMLASVIFIVALYVKGKKIRRHTTEMMGIPESERMTESQWKALKTLFVLILTLVIDEVGLIIVFLFYSIDKVFTHSPLLLIVGYLTVIYFITDPIVIMRNADAREALKAMMKTLLDKIRFKRR